MLSIIAFILIDSAERDMLYLYVFLYTNIYTQFTERLEIKYLKSGTDMDGTTATVHSILVQKKKRKKMFALL